MRVKMKRRFVLDDYFEDNPMPVSGDDLLWWNQASGFTVLPVVSKCEVWLTETDNARILAHFRIPALT